MNVRAWEAKGSVWGRAGGELKIVPVREHGKNRERGAAREGNKGGVLIEQVSGKGLHRDRE